MSDVLIEVGMKLISLNEESVWFDTDGNACLGPLYGETLTVRKVGVVSENDVLFGALWFDEFEGDTTDDAYHVEDFVIKGC